MRNSLAHTPHPLLIDGLVDGFKAPLTGYVGMKNPNPTPNRDELSHVSFNPGSSVCSNFWAGRIADMRAFADDLMDDIDRWIENVTPEDEDEDPVVAVCYWEDEESDMALVATISLTPDFMIDNVYDSEEFPSFAKHVESIIPIMFDGNDNGPLSFFNDVNMRELDEETKTRLLALSLSVVEEDMHNDMRENFDDRVARSTPKMSP